jgi:hypothetical protein
MILLMLVLPFMQVSKFNLDYSWVDLSAVGYSSAFVLEILSEQAAELAVYATLHGLNLNCGAGLRIAGDARWQEV